MADTFSSQSKYKIQNTLDHDIMHGDLHMDIYAQEYDSTIYSTSVMMSEVTLALFSIAWEIIFHFPRSTNKGGITVIEYDHSEVLAFLHENILIVHYGHT